MRNQKMIKALIAILLMICIAIIPSIVKAGELNPSLYFGITELRSATNMGYAIGNPNTNGETGRSAKIWNIVQYSGENTNDPTEVNVYCIKAGVGFTEGQGVRQIQEYNLQFDMYTERTDIASQDANTNQVLYKLVNGGHYNELLALANLIYIPGESTSAEREQLLKDAGVTRVQQEYEGLGEEYKITDDEIDAVQQAAMWYFTNYGEEDNKYDRYAEDSWLWYTEDGSTYANLSGYGTDKIPAVGLARQQQAVELYKYLIDTAKEQAGNYADSNAKHRNKLTLYTTATGNSQPLMKVEKIPQEFDLALRKYITEVNGVAVTNSRVPVIDESTLENGTTATYNHRKDPVLVENGDIVTYNITIYNEGEVDGRATQIIDQLPSGLKYSQITTAGFTAEYDEETNRVTIKRDASNAENLTAYQQGQLDSETIEIECLVDTSENGKILTNVAWISEEIDEYGNVIVDEVGEDRDSEPGTAPNVNKDNMENYKGNTDNKDDLTDSDYFYEGEQDDDDFEKLIVEHNDFDLKLIKRITELNGEKVPERLLGVDITNLANGSQTTADYQMNKEPVAVSKGDLVTYTFRIYNEGSIDGYVEELTEDIPEGLEFLGADIDSNMNPITDEDELSAVEFNTSMGWTYLEGDTTKISTDYLGKGKGAEITTPGANLIKAFDPNSPYADTETQKNPDYKEISVIFKVVAEDPSIGIIRNEAAITQDADSEGNPVDDRDSTPENWVKYEDDEDYDNIVLQEFDLALRKFITKVDEEDVTTRIPEVSYDREADQITYNHTKDPVQVATGNVVEYTIRVYNEGDIAGYAKEVADDIPDGLRFLPDNATNTEYRWVMYDKDGNRTENAEEAVEIRTDYLSKEQEQTEGENLLQAFNPDAEIGEGNPDYRDLEVAFEVVEPNESDRIIINSAQITDDSDENGNPVDDIDSIPDEWNDGEDDQDREYIKLTYFDLALRKFITKVDEEDVTTRIPEVSYDREQNKITYNHTKDPVEVVTGNVVEYTIRVYNEGQIAGYAQEVADDIPDGLRFLPDNATNTEYRWVMYDKDGNVTENAEEAVEIRTDYLSKEQEQTEGENLLQAFNPDAEIGEGNPDYRDLKVAFEVVEPNGSDRIIVNSAQITDDSDENGDPVEDIDSTPDEWNDGEDDQDREYIKLTYFDLALRKWVTEAIVIENGKETVTQTGHTAEMDPEPVVKVELYRKNINDVVVKFRYKIRITNEGDIAGYAKEITDYVPQGLRFVAEDNPGWTDEGNNIISTRLLENTLLQPGESAEVEVVLTWINGEDNMGQMTNIAEISEDYNDKGVPDRDSTPDNQVWGEDDIDDAPVLLSIETGQERIYYVLGFTVLGTLAGGLVLIKKFVI